MNIITKIIIEIFNHFDIISIYVYETYINKIEIITLIKKIDSAIEYKIVD